MKSMEVLSPPFGGERTRNGAHCMNIKQISKLAGVSTTTVSFVINNKPGISEETREHVFSVIEKAGYTPNLHSRRLTLKRSFTFYVLLPSGQSLEDVFYSTVLSTIIDQSEDFGYSVTVSEHTEPFAESKAALAIKQRDVDGILFLEDICPETSQYLQERDIPFVVVDSNRSAPEYPAVCCDYEEAANAAANYLIRKGHRDVAFIGTQSVPDFHTVLLKGFMRAVMEHGLTVPQCWIRKEQYNTDLSSAGMRAILSCGKLPTAVLCATDFIAIGAMNHTLRAGLRVPDDISFCGIDNQIVALCCYPALTTVNVDTRYMAKAAVEMLVAQIEKEEHESIVIMESDRIVERESVKDRTQPAAEPT